MAIDNPNVVDGIGIDEDQNAIHLLLTDHLQWTGEGAPDEHAHLMMLQDKINAYISFLEAGQYQDNYPGREFSMAVIEAHFKYDISDNCEKFLNVVQEQVGSLGIKIEAHIEE